MKQDSLCIFNCFNFGDFSDPIFRTPTEYGDLQKYHAIDYNRHCTANGVTL